MAVDRKLYPTSITFGSTTWNKDDGGPLELEISHGANAILEDATGADENPSFVAYLGKHYLVTVTLRDVTVKQTIGTTGTLSVVLGMPGGATSERNLGTARVESVRNAIGYGQYGTTQITFKAYIAPAS